MFVEDHQQALVRLLADPSIPEEFYYYWNDVVNAVGYTPKLLLMCSAIECLTRIRHGEKDWTKVERVLGWKVKTFAPDLAHIMVDAELLGRAKRAGWANPRKSA